ncbi:anthranilate synthase component II [Scopulibacillus cellulosilyticus]|uniref:Anthranilate synthase component II n=1 Tax=Scopulibacillus cellulosilyticus TaxID=2665665 RepID=A0ABW2PZE2_9BACL
MIVMIDNYDSFTYNLVQYFGELMEDIKVFRNDEITIEQIKNLNPDYIVISPGPCTPNEAGISLEVIRQFSGSVPILGVCLGHQAIAQAFGGRVVRANQLMHGKTSVITHDGETIFEGLDANLEVMRYHSLIVDKASLPKEFKVSARTSEGDIMAIRHKTLPIEGVQFHPESVMTRNGINILQRFLQYYANTVHS